MSEKPYGHVAQVRRRVKGSASSDGLSWKEEVVEFRAKGPLRVVERAARLTSGFLAIESVESYPDEASWFRVFGRGRA